MVQVSEGNAATRVPLHGLIPCHSWGLCVSFWPGEVWLVLAFLGHPTFKIRSRPMLAIHLTVNKWLKQIFTLLLKNAYSGGIGTVSFNLHLMPVRWGAGCYWSESHSRLLNSRWRRGRRHQWRYQIVRRQRWTPWPGKYLCLSACRKSVTELWIAAKNKKELFLTIQN